MTSRYRDLYDDLLRDVSRASQEIGDVLMTGFWPMHGAASHGQLLLVGRAVNGWGPEFTPSALIESSDRLKTATAIEAASASSARCPMLWVTERWNSSGEYSTARSAFWRGAKSLVQRLGLSHDQDTWPSVLAWSNLFKVSPAAGGNPEGALWRAQLPAARPLLHCELEEVSPRQILFATGLAWARPLLPGLINVTFSGGEAPPVEAYGDLRVPLASDGTRPRVVIAQHPQGKPEAEWVENVVAAFHAPA